MLLPPDSSPAPVMIEKRRLRPWMIVLVILVALGFILFPLIRGGVQAVVQVRDLKTISQEAYQHLQQGDVVAARQNILSARAMLPQMRTDLRRMGFWRFMPIVGVHVRALEDVTSASETTLASVADLLQVVESLQDAVETVRGVDGVLDHGVAASRSFQDLTPQEKRAILVRLRDSLPSLKIAREKMGIALAEWDGVEKRSLIKPVENILHPLVTQLHGYKTTLDQGIALTETVIPLAGLSSPKTYLVLLQNSDEMRPTGGFIGTIGLLSVDAGEITRMTFEDVYALDGSVQDKWNDQPPEMLARHLGVPAWFLRDSNWSPDFTVSAQRILDVYAREHALAQTTSTPLDGVIALQPKLFERLLQLTGPLQVSGKTFRAENFFDQLEYDVEIGFLQEGTPVHQRKEIVSEVGEVLLATLVRQPSSRWPEILNHVTVSLHEKDVLLYARAPDVQRMLDVYGWTGRVKPGTGDYLWVIDANLAALKTDGVMEKQIAYALDARDPENPIATVTLTYHNTNRSINWRYTRYRNYVRVYVPEGSELISSEGAMLNDKTKTGGRVIPGTVDVMRDLGKTVFGAFWAVEPGETRTLTFTYRLPRTTVLDQKDPSLYTLLVQRQPGSEQRLTLDLNFGKNIMSALPAEEAVDFGDMRYKTSYPLRADQTVHVKVASP